MYEELHPPATRRVSERIHLYMIDLCFSDSVKGALRCAQHDGIIGGAISIAVIGESHENEKELYEQQIRRTKNVQSLGGDPKDVLGLSWGLSIGDIAAPLSPICLRRELSLSVAYG